MGARFQTRQLENKKQRLKFVKSGLKFAKNFTNHALEIRKDKNVVCSPAGAHAILTLVVLGARKNTLTQLREVLFLKYNRFNFMLGSSLLMDAVDNMKKVTFFLANKIYVHEKSKIRKNFISILRRMYLNEIHLIDRNSSIFVAGANKWVRGMTNNKIKKILKKDDVTNTTSFVAFNAVYYYGNWEEPFDPSLTEEQDFYQFGGNTIKVPMMCNPSIMLNNGIIDKFYARFIELPYKKRGYKIIIVMPLNDYFVETKFEELGRHLKDIDYHILESINSFSRVRLSMPKFTVRSSINLEPILKKMGATDMFSSDRADFKLIAENVKLKVDRVVQKVAIVVNETASKYNRKNMYVPGSQYNYMDHININKPFYFAILSPLGVISEGRIVTPQYEDV
ncbi:antitrypsin-like [Copidosoma floridanum]|uniref:antitrypsin-like n=1 Tax=Copidosoma floridanum TaxID=29053 RepID=UPI0006C9754C|nr:antitrypsin-like [Copidosoma floridanum]